MKRGIKLLQSFPENSQPRRIADTVPTHVLLSPAGCGAILTALHEKYAPFLEACGPQAIDKFLFEGERAKNESFSSYIAAKELARQEMEAQLGERISEKLCGRIFLRQATLTEMQREMVMLSGPALRTFTEVASLLRPLDRPEMLVRGEAQSSKHYFVEDFDDQDQEEEELSNESNSVMEDESGNLLMYVEDREYTEDEAMAVFAYHTAYRDVRKQLQKRRNERGYVRRDHRQGSRGRGGDRRGRGASRGQGKGRGHGTKASEQELLMRTGCFSCNDLGHIAKDCPLKRASSSSTSTPSKPFVKKGFIVINGGASNTTYNDEDFCP